MASDTSPGEWDANRRPIHSIDRIDLRAGRRTTITTDGGPLLAVATRSGRLATFDTAGQLVVRTPTDGRVLGALADYKALTGQDTMTGGVGDAAIAAVEQAGERVVGALPTTVPYQDLVSGATTGGLVTVTFRDLSSARTHLGRTLRFSSSASGRPGTYPVLWPRTA